GSPSDPPLPESISLEFAFVGGALRPVVKLVGERFEFQGVHGDVEFLAPGLAAPILQTGSNVQFGVENGKNVLRAVIPQQLAIGMAEVRVSRPRPPILPGGPDVSIALALKPAGKYIFGALPTEQRVLVIDQSTREVVAKIAVPGVPLDTTVTPDATRVYVPLVAGSVAVIDALALQLIDADVATAQIDTIPLGPASAPFQATVDPASRFL